MKKKIAFKKTKSTVHLYSKYEPVKSHLMSSFRVRVEGRRGFLFDSNKAHKTGVEEIWDKIMKMRKRVPRRRRLSKKKIGVEEEN